MERVLASFLLGGGNASGAPQPWTAGRVAKTVGIGVGLGAAGGALWYTVSKLAAVPSTAPSPLRGYLGEPSVRWLEAHPAMREVCERLMRFATHARHDAFVTLLAACARTAEYVLTLGSKENPYTFAASRVVSQLTHDVERALTEFQRGVPPHARRDYEEVDDDMDKVLSDIKFNVRVSMQFLEGQKFATR